MKIDNLIGDNYLNRDAVMELILSKRVEKNNPASRVIVDRKVKDIVFAVLNGTSFETSDELIASLEKNLVVILIDVYEELICSNFNCNVKTKHYNSYILIHLQKYEVSRNESFMMENKYKSRKISKFKNNKDLLRLWKDLNSFPFTKYPVDHKRISPTTNVEIMSGPGIWWELLLVPLVPLIFLLMIAEINIRSFISKRWNWIY